MKTNIQETNVCSNGKDVVDKLSKIDKYDQLQKFKDQLQSSNDTPTTSVNVNQDRIEQNHAKLGLTIIWKIRISTIILITRIKHQQISITTVIFGDGIQKGINVRNLNTRLSTENCKCCFFDRAKSNHFTTIVSKRYANQTTKQILLFCTWGQMTSLMQKPMKILLLKVL